MLQLTTLGGVLMTRDGATLPWTQRGWQRSALCALLAAAGRRGVDRTLLAAVLWPDSMESAARHSLDEMLSRARRETECKDLFTGTASVAWNTEVVAVDVPEFETAIAGQHYERAVQLYRGPFADGLRLADADDAERRIDATRTRLAERYVEALEALAQRAHERGDHHAEASWWSRVVQQEPLSARAAKAYLLALVAADETPRALAHVRVYQALLQQELGVAPDADILEIERRLRASASTRASGTDVPPRAVIAARVAPEQAVAEHLARRLERLVGREYTLGALVESGSVAAVHQLTRRDTGAPAELQVFTTRCSTPADQRHFTQTFERVASLSHAAIVPVLAFGVEDETAFVITAARPRETLREWLRTAHALPIADAVALARAIAAPLRFAHARGVCHGDLRPKRIGLARRDPILSGFGIVEAQQRGTPDLQRSTVRALGSPAYQSPEQFGGDVGADIASDIYAFGSIVYEMLVGAPPFGRATDAGVMRRKMTEPPPALGGIRELVPPSVERVVMRCLSRFPADRLDCLEELAQLP